MANQIYKNLEMNDIVRLLSINNIPFEIYISAYYPNCITVAIPNVDNRELDVACNPATYGNKIGLLELYREDGKQFDDTNDSVVGWLNSTKCLELIKDYFANK